MKDMLEGFIEDHLNERWNISYEYCVSNPYYSCYNNYIHEYFIGCKTDVEVGVKDFFEVNRKKYMKAYVNIGLYEIDEEAMDDNVYVHDKLTAFKKEAILQFLLFENGKLLTGYQNKDPILDVNTWKLLIQDDSDKEFFDSVYAKGNVLLEAHTNGQHHLKSMIDKLYQSDLNDFYELSSRIYQLDSQIFKKIAYKFLLQLHTESTGVITRFITTDFAIACCPFEKMHIVKYAGQELSASLIGEKKLYFTLSIKDNAKVCMKICDMDALDVNLLASPVKIRGKVHIVKMNRKRKSF